MSISEQEQLNDLKRRVDYCQKDIENLKKEMINKNNHDKNQDSQIQEVVEGNKKILKKLDEWGPVLQYIQGNKYLGIKPAATMDKEYEERLRNVERAVSLLTSISQIPSKVWAIIITILTGIGALLRYSDSLKVWVLKLFK